VGHALSLNGLAHLFCGRVRGKTSGLVVMAGREEIPKELEDIEAEGIARFR